MCDDLFVRLEVDRENGAPPARADRIFLELRLLFKFGLIDREVSWLFPFDGAVGGVELAGWITETEELER